MAFGKKTKKVERKRYNSSTGSYEVYTVEVPDTSSSSSDYGSSSSSYDSGSSSSSDSGSSSSCD